MAEIAEASTLLLLRVLGWSGTAFMTERIELRQFAVPTTGVWAGARQVSALHSLMVHGPDVVKRVLEARASTNQPFLRRKSAG
ncbi:hypothetical protein ACIQOV_27695 [Kitasatospora sp. NPDC091257]|uniref:hypothetical protein n=1 Tax=Kitasatospora sp. NPDC091257 TaxID=3364084 RepID=UPI00382CE484